MDIDQQLHVILQALPEKCGLTSMGVDPRFEFKQTIKVGEGNAAEGESEVCEPRFVSQMCMGKLLDAVLHTNCLTPQYIGKRPTRMIIPLIGPEKRRLLVVALAKKSHSRAEDEAYIVEVAKCLQGAMQRAEFQ